jgi:hypothetical protein
MKVTDIFTSESGIYAEIDIVPNTIVFICTEDHFVQWLIKKGYASDYMDGDQLDRYELFNECLTTEIALEYIISQNIKVRQ